VLVIGTHTLLVISGFILADFNLNRLLLVIQHRGLAAVVVFSCFCLQIHR